MNRTEMDVITNNKKAPKADLLAVVNARAESSVLGKTNGVDDAITAPLEVLFAVLNHPKLNKWWRPFRPRIMQIINSIGTHPNADDRVLAAINQHSAVGDKNRKEVIAEILKRRSAAAAATVAAATSAAELSLSSSSVGSGDGSRVVTTAKDEHHRNGGLALPDATAALSTVVADSPAVVEEAVASTSHQGTETRAAEVFGAFTDDAESSQRQATREKTFYGRDNESNILAHLYNFHKNNRSQATDALADARTASSRMVL